MAPTEMVPTGMAWLAFLLLIAALVLFIVSTRQWPLRLRGSIWGVALVLLILAGVTLGGAARDDKLERVFIGLITGNDFLSEMLARNGPSVGLMVLSLFDLFIGFGVVVAVLALIAFSPGETMEKIIRPLMSGMIGAIFGGLIALTMVGTGFGSRAPQPAYGGAATAVDGNTLLVQETLVRLRGVNAPLPGHICRRPNGTQAEPYFDCGAEATVALSQIIQGSEVLCDRDDTPETTGQNAQPNNQQQARGGNGRELMVTCMLMGRDGPQFNIGQRMVEQGYAASRGDVFAREAQIAQTNPRNLTAWCSLRPEVWARRSTAEKNAFRDSGARRSDWATFGTCPPPPVSRRTGSRDTRERSAPD